MKTLWKNLKSGHDIGKIHTHNFSVYICFAWFLYTSISPVIHGNQQKIHFLQLYQGPCIILEKSTMKTLLMAFKYVAVAVTFNKFKNRCIHCHLVSMHPSNLPTEIILFCYQLFSFYLFIFTLIKCRYITYI